MTPHEAYGAAKGPCDININPAYAQFTLIPDGTPVWVCKKSVVSVMLQDGIEGKEGQRASFLMVELGHGKGYNVKETPEEVLEALRFEENPNTMKPCDEMKIPECANLPTAEALPAGGL